MSALAPGLLLSPTPTRSPRAALIRAWVPTFVWIGVIAFESTGVFTSEHTYGWIYLFLNRVFGTHVAQFAVILNDVGRKFGHFTGYSILSLLSFRGWNEWLTYRRNNQFAAAGKPPLPRRWHLRAAVLGVLVTLVVASLDEFHQTFLPGRTGTYRDVILDTFGGIFAQILVLLLWKTPTGKHTSTPSQVGPVGSVSQS